MIRPKLTAWVGAWILLSLLHTRNTVGVQAVASWSHTHNRTGTATADHEEEDPTQTRRDRHRVVVIGAGPAGLFFLHALASQRQKFVAAGDTDLLETWPEVTVFEKASDPGGVWRPASSSSTTTSKKSESVQMFGGLWTNSPSVDMEFFDYTYRDHHRRRRRHNRHNGEEQPDDGAMPVYLPRKKFLEYMLARVTSVEDIFQHVQFNTKVTWVEYDDDEGVFRVGTETETVVDWDDEDTVAVKRDGSLHSHHPRNHNRTTPQCPPDTGTRTRRVRTTAVHEFDQCIWAGGTNAVPYYPDRIDQLLTTPSPSSASSSSEPLFRGRTYHSADLADLDDLSLAGRNLVLVGDSYSAEDLTLQALKAGAARVYMTSSHRVGTASPTSTWPGDRAESLKCLPTQVIHNGTGLFCAPVEWDEDEEDYVPVSNGMNGTTEGTELADIAAVIYCTGYHRDMHYLAPDLHYQCKHQRWTLQYDWESPRNSLSQDLGHVDPAESLHSKFVCGNMYRHVLIDNPNMMYLQPITDFYIPEIDAMAWAVAAYVTGETVPPSREEMILRNHLDRIDELRVPSVRRQVDPEYARAVQSLRKAQPDHWLHSKDLTGPFGQYYRETVRHSLKLIARDHVAGGHGAGWGSYDQLSPRGEHLVDQFLAEDKSREFPVIPEERPWRTFRDIHPGPFESLYTGIKAAPLKGHWMDLDDDGEIASSNLLQ